MSSLERREAMDEHASTANRRTESWRERNDKITVDYFNSVKHKIISQTRNANLQENNSNSMNYNIKILQLKKIAEIYAP
jgi:hypothetical protein